MWGSNATTVADVDTESAWQQAHRALKRLARERAAADAEEARWLLAALRSAVHVHLGFATFGEYVERLFGYAPRSTQDRLRVAEALERLPMLARALERGELSWSAVRELTRVAVAETEREWLSAAADRKVERGRAAAAGVGALDGGANVMSSAMSCASAEHPHGSSALLDRRACAMWYNISSALARSSSSVVRSRSKKPGDHPRGQQSSRAPVAGVERF